MVFSNNVTRASESPLDDAMTSEINTIKNRFLHTILVRGSKVRLFGSPQWLGKLWRAKKSHFRASEENGMKNVDKGR